jgi:hypothetical protein
MLLGSVAGAVRQLFTTRTGSRHDQAVVAAIPSVTALGQGAVAR